MPADTSSRGPAVEPAFVQMYQENLDSARAELQAGLLATPARVAPKYFYDALGSRLFDAITELAEYYPTRTEAGIFQAHAADMAQLVPAGAVLFDLGAGNCAKAASLFGALQPGGYVAVDISVEHMRACLNALQQRHPQLPMLGLGLDFSSALTLPAQVPVWQLAHGLQASPRVALYPGSSIGNFNPDEALALLRQIHALCASGGPGGGLLIGVDRVKAAAVLEPAYDDTLGVTAAFNRNLLLHVNRLLSADFAPAQWQHVAMFNAVQSRIEMHLQATSAQTVRWPGGERTFAAGERVHTENSYKWEPEAFTALLREAGFGPAQHWSDAQDWFSVFWAPVA